MMLKVLPFSLDMNRKYDIDVVVMKDVYAFCVDGEALMTIVDKQHLFEDWWELDWYFGMKSFQAIYM